MSIDSFATILVQVISSGALFGTFIGLMAGFFGRRDQ